MAVRKRTTRKVAVRRKSVAKKPVRRRRRTMSNPFSKATMRSAGKMVIKGAIGGAVAEIVDQQISSKVASVLPSAAQPFASAITLGLAAYATKVYGKQVDVAAGMAGVAGAKLAAGLVAGGAGAPIQDMAPMALNYAMSEAMPLSGYQVPMSDDGIYASDYANQFS